MPEEIPDPVKKTVADQAFIMLLPFTALTLFTKERLSAQAWKQDDYTLLVDVDDHGHRRRFRISVTEDA